MHHHIQHARTVQKLKLTLHSQFGNILSGHTGIPHLQAGMDAHVYILRHFLLVTLIYGWFSMYMHIYTYICWISGDTRAQVMHMTCELFGVSVIISTHTHKYSWLPSIYTLIYRHNSWACGRLHTDNCIPHPASCIVFIKWIHGYWLLRNTVLIALYGPVAEWYEHSSCDAYKECASQCKLCNIKQFSCFAQTCVYIYLCINAICMHLYTPMHVLFV